MPFLSPEEVKFIAAHVKAGLLSAIGGIVGYAVDVMHRGQTFSITGYLVFVFTAFFVGQVLWSWLPTDMPGKGGILMIAGTAAYPALTAMQARIIALIEKLR